jgi:hypothetical protein
MQTEQDWSRDQTSGRRSSDGGPDKGKSGNNMTRGGHGKRWCDMAVEGFAREGGERRWLK